MSVPKIEVSAAGGRGDYRHRASIHAVAIGQLPYVVGVRYPCGRTLCGGIVQHQSTGERRMQCDLQCFSAGPAKPTRSPISDLLAAEYALLPLILAL
jgi:hypothetical protein